MPHKISESRLSNAQASDMRSRVASLLALGYENKEIAKALELPDLMVREYIHRLRTQHNIQTTRRLVLYLAQAPGHWPHKSKSGLFDSTSYLVKRD